jgi:hypothetical protein
MFGRNMYSDNDSMFVTGAIVIVVLVLIYLMYRRNASETSVGNPYAGTFYGMVPFSIFKGAVPIPAANY